MNTKTPETRAEERYPAPKYVPMPEGLDEIFAPDVRHTKQFAYADCIREQVEPLEAEIIRLRAEKCVHCGRLRSTPDEPNP